MPPEDIALDVKSNYISTAGVTIDGQIWGIPTEVNDYALVYNKKLFKEAGIVDENGNAKPPTTWSELVSYASKTTKRDDSGNIIRYGFAVSKDMDWGIVDPFLSLLYSNGGKFLSDSNSKCLVNSPQGLEALNAYLELFDNGATDINSNILDFGKGQVAMVIVAPWHEGIIKPGMGENFTSETGVVAVPYMKTPASLQYSWFTGVMAKSKHKKESWEFLKWMTSDIQKDTGTTRYGDLLARNIGAIPSRNVDLSSNRDKLSNFFKKPYVDNLAVSVPEPNIIVSSEIKQILMEELQAAMAKEKIPKTALDDACARIDMLVVKK
jgi:multiple sugar transport system substrate-binding protein